MFVGYKARDINPLVKEGIKASLKKNPGGHGTSNVVVPDPAICPTREDWDESYLETVR